MSQQENIRQIAENIAADVAAENIQSEADLANCREVARQLAANEAAYQRTGWKSQDYANLNSAIFQAVYRKLTSQ